MRAAVREISCILRTFRGFSRPALTTGGPREIPVLQEELELVGVPDLVRMSLAQYCLLGTQDNVSSYVVVAPQDVQVRISDNPLEDVACGLRQTRRVDDPLDDWLPGGEVSIAREYAQGDPGAFLFMPTDVRVNPISWKYAAVPKSTVASRERPSCRASHSVRGATSSCVCHRE